MLSLALTISDAAAIVRHIETAALAVILSNPPEALRLALLASELRREAAR